MNPDLAKLAITGIVGAHGIGHILGLFPAWGIASFTGLSTRSWLLTDTIGDAASRFIGGGLWAAGLVGFIAAAGGYMTNQPWTQPVAAGASIISLVAIGLFPDALPAGSRVGAIAVNLLVLAAVAREVMATA